MNIETDTLLIIALIIINIVLALTVIFLNKRINGLLGGKTEAKNFTDSIALLNNDIKNLEEFKAETSKYLGNLENRVKSSMRGIATVRFNPFKGTGSGGNQSFATAIINEDGDGVIISSLYSREHVSVFSKPIKKHTCEFDLTEEEKEAFTKAKEQL